MKTASFVKKTLALALAILLLAAQCPSVLAAGTQVTVTLTTAEGTTVTGLSNGDVIQPARGVSASVTAQTGYKPVVTITGGVTDPDTHFDEATGQLTIAADAITGDFTVAVTQTPKSYALTHGTDVALENGVTTATFGQTVSGTVMVPTGRALRSVTAACAAGNAQVTLTDNAFSFTMPAGDVEVTANYGLPLTGNYTVTPAPVNGWNRDDEVTIAALNGLHLTTDQAVTTGTLPTEITLFDPGTHTYYLTDGTLVSEAIVIKIDRTAPTGEIKRGEDPLSQEYTGPVATEDWIWNEVQSDADITITGVDTNLASVKYRLMAKADYDVMAQKTVEAVKAQEFTTYNSNSPKLLRAQTVTGTQLVLFALLTDAAGNETLLYTGIKIDNAAPTVSVLQDGQHTEEVTIDGTARYYATGADCMFTVFVPGDGAPLSDSTVTVKRDGNTVATGYTVDLGWDPTQINNESGYALHITLNVSDADAVPDGTYTVGVTVKKENKLTATATSAELIVNRKTPSASLTYAGYVGYDDENGVYHAGVNGAAVKENIEENVAAPASVFTIYTTDSMTMTFVKSPFRRYEVKAYKVGVATPLAAGYEVSESGIITLHPGEDGVYYAEITVTNWMGKVTVLTSANIIFDTAAPTIDDLAGLAFADGDEANGTALASGAWTNAANVKISGTVADAHLFAGCVTADNGITVTHDFDTDPTVWNFTVIDEQNMTYTITVKDKSGNENEVATTYTACIDRTKPTDGSITVAKAGDEAVAWTDVSAQLTFGILRGFAVTVKLAAEDTVQPTAADAASGVASTQYYIDEALASIDVFLADTTDAGVNSCAIAEGDWLAYDAAAGVALDTNKRAVVYFRVTDVAGNVAYRHSSVILTDGTAPEATITLLTAPRNTQTGIYTAADFTDAETGDPTTINIGVTPSDPGGDGLFTGIEMVAYKLYNGPVEISDGTLYDASSATARHERAPVELADVARTASAANIELDNGVYGPRLHAVITITDNAGNEQEYDTADIFSGPGAATGYLNIDTLAPVVTVTFDPSVDGKLYYQTRSADVTVVDTNFVAEKVELGCGTLDAWVGTDPDGDGVNEHWTNTITFVPDGVYDFSLAVEDAAGNRTEDADVNYTQSYEPIADFVVDATDPLIMVSYARADGKNIFTGDYSNSPVTLHIQISEVNFNGAELHVTRNGVDISGQIALHWAGGANSHRAAYTFDVDGEYAIRVSCTDKAGNTDAVTDEGFILDTVAPEIDISGVKDKSANKAEKIAPVVTVTDVHYSVGDVSVELSGGNGGEAFYDAADVRGGNGEVFTYENIETDDMYTLTVTARDLAENEATQTIVFSVNRHGSVFTPGEVLKNMLAKTGGYFPTEDLPPVVVVETNVDLITSAKLYLTKDDSVIDLKEGDYTIERKVVNGGWSQYIYTLDPALFTADGVYRVSLVTKDKAGNAVNAESVLSFIVDNTPPILLVNDLEPGVSYNTELKTVTFSVTDNMVLGQVRVLLNGEEVAAWDAEAIAEMRKSGESFSFDIPEKSERQSVQIVCADAAGNENADQLISGFYVTTNIIIRYYSNKPLFYGSIGAAAAAGVGLWFALSKKKKTA